MKHKFKTTHKLKFQTTTYKQLFEDGYHWQEFIVGTCRGLFTSTDRHWILLAIDNEQPGNGHFTDVMEWFERFCKRDKKDFVIMEVWNKRLLAHLLTKRGFELYNPITNSLIKKYEYAENISKHCEELS